MDKDLLILKLLKIPVIVIQYISRTLAMFTYIPNYFVILFLDYILFHSKSSSTFFNYILWWLPRLFSLILVLFIFIGQFYAIYDVLKIYENHWSLQIFVMVLATSGLLFLMRKGYLSMIKRFNPTKLKSPMEHLQLGGNFLYDLLCILLTLVNILMIVRAHTTWKYEFKGDEFRFVKHISKRIHESILIYVKFFYVYIFFKIFPWRYNHSLETIKKEEDKILHLFVLLTLLFLQTLLDLLALTIFGLYGVIHPKRKIFYDAVSKTHQKWKGVKFFMTGSILQNTQITILILCLPLKFKQSKELLAKIISSKDYKRNELKATMQILRLAAVKLPSLICILFLRISIYKYKKYKNLISQQNSPPKQYVSFKCFSSLLGEIPYWGLLLTAVPLKLWNIKVLKKIMNQDYNLQKQLICNIWEKNYTDLVALLPAILTILIVTIYDPIKNYQELKKKIKLRSQLKKGENLQFYSTKNSIVLMILSSYSEKIIKDIFYLPFYTLCRLSLFSIFQCVSPNDAPPLFESFLQSFYKYRVQKRGYFNHFIEIQKIDKSAGLLKTQHQRLRFWKFAYKICKHKSIIKIVGFFMPKKKVEKVKNLTEKQTRFSQLSNEYWTSYKTMLNVIKRFIFLIIEVVLTLIGIFLMTPLTLWRLPTFFIIFKKHEFAKKMFFSILPKMYKRMIFDIIELPVRLIALMISPRHVGKFLLKTIFRYGNCSLRQFEKLEGLKYQYIKQIFNSSFQCIIVMVKIGLIKLLWVRKLQLANKVKSQNLAYRQFVKQIFSSAFVPSIEDLLERGVGSHQLPVFTKVRAVVDDVFVETQRDIPYLFLMVFLMITLPWRIFYIKKALLMMRQKGQNRRQFIKLVKQIAKDYQCIMLYLLLILTIVKAKRSVQLFIRNVKINFYVGLLRYSAVKELRKELKEAGSFYLDIFIFLFALFLSPYRFVDLKQSLRKVYAAHQREKKISYENNLIYENTLRSGKEVKILSKMGYQCFLTTCTFLTTPELVRLTRVNHFTYDMIKSRDEVWFEHWNRMYKIKYPHAKQENYNELCVDHYRKENKSVKKQMTYFHEIALEELNFSRQSQFNLKQFLRNKINPETHLRIFTFLLYQNNDGFGPEANWPQPGDNPEFLRIMNIERRPVEQKDEMGTIFMYLFIYPSQFFIIRLTRLFTVNSHRKKKQLFYVSIIFGGFVCYFMTIYLLWSHIWEITPFIGIKVLFIAYVHFLLAIFKTRFQSMSSTSWRLILQPFDLVDDVINLFKTMFRFLKRKATDGGKWVEDKIKKWVVRPLKWVWKKVCDGAELVWKKIKKIMEFFVEKVAKPFYLQLSKYLRACWNLLKQFYSFSLSVLKKIIKRVANIFQQAFKLFLAFFRNLSHGYYHILKKILTIGLKFGMVGELVATIIILALMLSPPFTYYLFYYERWFFIMSIISTMILVMVGYKHLRKIRQQI